MSPLTTCTAVVPTRARPRRSGPARSRFPAPRGRVHDSTSLDIDIITDDITILRTETAFLQALASAEPVTHATARAAMPTAAVSQPTATCRSGRSAPRPRSRHHAAPRARGPAGSSRSPQVPSAHSARPMPSWSAWPCRAAAPGGRGGDRPGARYVPHGVLLVSTTRIRPRNAGTRYGPGSIATVSSGTVMPWVWSRHRCRAARRRPGRGSGRWSRTRRRPDGTAAGVVRGDQVLGAVLGPLDRPAQRPRQPRHQVVLRVELATHPEPAACVMACTWIRAWSMRSMAASRSRSNTGTLVMPKIDSPPVRGSGSASSTRGSSGTPVCRPISISASTTRAARRNAVSVSP